MNSKADVCYALDPSYDFCYSKCIGPSYVFTILLTAAPRDLIDD